MNIYIHLQYNYIHMYREIVGSCPAPISFVRVSKESHRITIWFGRALLY